MDTIKYSVLSEEQNKCLRLVIKNPRTRDSVKLDESFDPIRDKCYTSGDAKQIKEMEEIDEELVQAHVIWWRLGEQWCPQ